MPAKPTARTFRKQLEAALERAVAELHDQIGSERLYAFVLYTSGERDFGYVCASANTVAGLARIAGSYAKKKPAYRGDAGLSKLRWSMGDWELHDFAEEVSGLKLPEGSGEARDAQLYKDFVAALKALDARGVFGKGKARPTLAIACGDMSHAFLERSLRLLNPPAAVAKYRDEYSPEPYLEELAKLPKAKKVDALIPLYRDLALDRPTPPATEAKRRNVTHFALRPLVEALGPPAVAALLDLVEAHGFGPTFYAKESPERAKYGAFTLAAKLAASAAAIAGSAGPNAAETRRMQAILARRVDADQAEEPASLLAFSVASALHAHDPERFPAAMKSPKTNRLENAEAFLEPGARSRG